MIGLVFVLCILFGCYLIISTIPVQYKLVPAIGCEGNHRSGVALAMRYRLSGISTYRPNGLRKGDEHLAYAPFGVLWHLYLYLYQCSRLLGKARLQNDLLGYVSSGMLLLNSTHSLTHSLTQICKLLYLHQQ